MVFQHRFSGGLAGGDTWMFGWWATSAFGIDTVHNAGIAWANAFWTGGYDSVVTADVTMLSLTTVNVDTGTGLQSERRDGALALAGTNVSGNLPADVAMVVSLRTALANRRGRGRFYLPQPAINQLAGATGRIAAATITDVLASLAGAWTGYVGTGQPVVYSRASRATSPVLTFDMGDLFDTQRGREDRMIESRTSQGMP